MSNDAYAASFAQEVADLEANTPEALAAKDAAYAVYLEKVAAYNESLKKPQSNWFNTDSSPFGRGPP